MGFSSVMSRSTTVGSSSMRRMSEQAPTFRKVAYSLMFESPTMTCRRRYRSESACGSSRVLMIGRDRVVADETPSQMCSARWEIENCDTAGGLEDLAGAGVDLAAHQERDEHLGVVVQVVVAAGQVVLVAAVAVARRVGVVAEQVDVAPDALLGEALLGGLDELLRGSTPPPCRAPPGRAASRTPAWRTRGASRRRGTAGHRWPGRRWRSDPRTRPAGTGSGRPRRG